jgi:hypothetical protein
VAMNVKVKMPNFRRPKNGSSVTKELLMSVIGTTISIVLTFGTAYLIDNHQRKAEGRDIAMMVIHDIDQYVEIFREEAEEDTERHDLTMYVLEHIDSIEAIPSDTIDMVISYISYLEGYGYKFDESVEKTFQSNQDIWRSIDAPSFIDNARAYFHNRRMIFQLLNSSTSFRRPVDQEQIRQVYAAALRSGKDVDWYAFLRKTLQEEDVLLYIQLHYQRQSILNSTADSFQDMSNRCKFIMSITDEELQAFLDKRKRTGEKLTDSKLIGRWSTQEDQPQTFEFKKDHTFKQILVFRYPSLAYRGYLNVTHTYTGSWKIKKDTLYRYFDADFDFKIDRSSINYSPEKRDTVEQILKKVEAFTIEQKKKQDRDTIVRAAVIDRSGNKVELTFPENDQNGRVSYLIREKATEKP